ncbi:GerMN domain-containing protein [Clostridium sp. ZS2-4]|uniref:GerMN domain-containing protein n=1 Tax=Clostridium sp. ZS2-4 TaxID=2987703 RepID=UPI00227D5C43|nr:GerMN domain-containing protein [Clostridium sp. ZS2-4]MCY6355200.1 GerMN domain-containing protein [Clostridium sp. ZS2-4]
MRKIYKCFLIMLAIISLATLVGCGNENKANANNAEKIKKLKLANSDDDSLNLNIYFDASKNENEVQVAREERIIQKDELIGEIIMQQLIKGPSVKSKAKPVFPSNTRILSFSIKDNIAYVNLSSNARCEMTSAREEACLRSIALSLAELQSIHKVKILVENKNIESLGGNFNISKPFNNDGINFIKIKKK